MIAPAADSPRPSPDGSLIDATIDQPARSLWSDAWGQFRANKLAMIGMAFLLLVTIVAIFADLIAPYGITERDSSNFRAGPSSAHLFGTDTIGLDLFSLIVHGSRVSLRIGVGATVLSLAVGLFVGAVSGYFGGWLDSLMMRITDIFLAVPYIVLAIAVATVFGKSENSVILVLGLTGWLAIARIVRSSFLQLKQLEYVEAARAMGFSRWRIMFRHILPNALQPIIVYGTISIGSAILAESALSFLGVGPQFPTPAWGRLIAENKGALASAPHLVIFPGLAISLTVLSFVLVGDGLRDALDPKLRER